MGGEQKQSFLPAQGSLGHYWLILTFSLLFSLSLFPATIKPPDVTCIPKVRSIQMIIHPTSTPILTGDGRRLTLEDIFKDLFYRLELHVNQTYQMVSTCAAPVLPGLGKPCPSQLEWHCFKSNGAVLYKSAFHKTHPQPPSCRFTRT